MSLFPFKSKMVKYQYFNRDISWLSFNHRVLEEAKDADKPVYERLNFLAIYSNNLEEFYKVRVSYYRDLLRKSDEMPEKVTEVNPAAVLREINEIVARHQMEFDNIFTNQILPELRRNNIFLLDRNDDLLDLHKKTLLKVFESEVLPAIQPVLLIKKKIKPFLKTGHVYLILKLFTKSGGITSFAESRAKYGMIKLPTDHDISRFIELPPVDGKYYIMFLEDVIMRHIEYLFPGYNVKDWYSVKLTRDADLVYDEYEGEDLIEVIGSIESSRAMGLPNRFQYDNRMPVRLLRFLQATFDLDDDVMVKGRPIHNFRDFFSFPNPRFPELQNEPLAPLKVPELDVKSVLSVLEKKEFLLHYPFHSFSYFLKFLNEVAQSDDVEEIKLTQYRLASHSAVVNALINAALNGKRVTVFVELKARFDEEANLRYAEEMKKAGINIIYSIPGLKVHAKMALVTCKAAEGTTPRRYLYLSTGNFNEKTARIYCDIGFFTTDDKLLREAALLFEHLADQTVKLKLKHILVPNINMVPTFIKLIEQEIENVKAGKRGYILLKMNGLQDIVLVNKLYDASLAGVKIDLIVRGVCILVPNQSYSKNVRLIRIVDRFLEHSRVFVFYNNGENIIYTGSADWMKRNLYARIECVFPIYNKKFKEEILDLLKIQINDNTQACLIDEHLNNVPVRNAKRRVRAQLDAYEYLKEKAAK